MTNILFFLVLIPGLSFGQVGHEWINVGQIYYKIPVAKNGLYKLTQNDLAQAGVPVDQIDPRRIQLFHRGVEQSLLFQHQQSPADGVFDASEFFEFYGKKNDGTLDAHLYKPSSDQPHSFYNLYNDTAYYFLTVHPTAQGKRMSNFSQINTGSLPIETYHTSERLELFTNSYAVGETVSSFVQLTSFDQGEGWSGSVLRENTSTNVVINNLTNGVPAGGQPTIEIQVLGRALVNHRAEIYVGQNTGSLQLLSTVDFFGYTPYTLNASLNWTDISATGSLTVQVRIVGAGGSDFVSVSYVRVSYPRSFTMSGDTERYFSLATIAEGKSYVEIQNAPVASRIFDITDTNNLIQIGTTQSSSLNAVINTTNQERRIFVTSLAITPTSIKRITFRSFNSLEADFVIISHKNFQKPALGSANPLKAYASYRASAAGGNYDTLTVTIDQLFNQFSYGESTPLAIFRFLKFLETTKRPDYLFIIGKGLDVGNRYYRNPTAFTEYKDYVPVAGTPASDMYFSVGLSDPDTNEPGIATGRISVTRSEQVIQYLNKVIEQEASGYKDLGRKRVLHLSGGISAGEPETFKGYMEDFALTAKGVFLGGSVSAIAKRSLQAQELINISEEVNKGLGLITFFGHSSSSTTDFDIGFATEPQLGYDNKGNYPMLLINGCNAGAFFSNNILFGEDWVNAADRGAVGFIAHSSFGLVSTLKRYSDIFYQVAYGDSTFLKKGVGDVQKETARRYLNGAFLSTQNISQIQQMVLLGDPSVKLFGATLPDYAIDASSVSALSPDGKTITATSPFMDVKVVVKNFGRAENKNVKVRVTRTLPDNSTLSYDSSFNAVLFQDTLVVRIPNAFSYAGNNRFEVKVDADEWIDELNETNNLVAFQVFIPLNGTKNLYPQNFALINSVQPELVFQSANLLDSLRSFIIEIDTTYLFNSSWKVEQTLEAELLARVSVDLLSNDSITYYWRTRLKHPSVDENAAWETSSFTYILGSHEGWGQLAFPQYLTNTTDDLLLQETTRRMSFEETVTPVLIKTFGDLNTAPVTDVSVKIDGVEYNLSTQDQPCRDNTINLLAFNRINTIPYAAIPFNFQDPRSCGREPQVIVSFRPSEVYNGGVDDLIQAIANVANGDSVVIFSIGNPSLISWHPDVVNKLGEVGISLVQLASITAGEPFVFFGKKGSAAASAQLFMSELSPAAEQELVVNRSVTGRKASGRMTSVLVGPAKQWQVLKSTVTLDVNDATTIDVIGISSSGQSTMLLEDVTSGTSLAAISAVDYPLLQLVYTTTDNTDLTPAHLNNWLVEYESLPEGILFLEEEVPTIHLQEGETWTGKYGFMNISTKSFIDSLVVRYASVNKVSNLQEEKQRKIAAPLPGDTTHFQVDFSTINKIGLNDVLVRVNPLVQPELFIDNNVLALNDAFEVEVDDVHPVLTVLVDGRLVNDGDFVSPNPQITISLWDENKLILKTDTTGMRMLLQYPCETNCTPTIIYFARSDVAWSAATTTRPFQVFFNPVNLTEGRYTLQVFAEDARGNESGEEPYSITFEVRSENSIDLSSPYPNPSKGKIAFDLILRGSEIPGDAWFEVMNTLGELITEANLPSTPWHIGTNTLMIELGDRLSDGLYVYKIRFANGKVQRGQFLISN